MALKNLVQKLVLATTILVSPITGLCEESTNDISKSYREYKPDVNGTWYLHGSSFGGWYGPYKEKDFGFFSLKQEGTNVVGKYQNELSYREREVSGTIEGCNLQLRIYSTNNTASTYSNQTNSVFSILVYGEKGHGTSTIDGVNSSNRACIEKVSTNFMEKIAPRPKRYD